jgi:CBS domain-containing protein
MTRDVYFVDPDEGLEAVWESMKMLGIRHVPVLEGGKLVGMLSDRDVLKHATFQGPALRVPPLKARSAMAAPVVVCKAGDALSEVGRTMLAHQIDSVVIVDDDGELTGLVTSTDFIHLVLQREAHDLGAPPPWDFKVRPLKR